MLGILIGLGAASLILSILIKPITRGVKNGLNKLNELFKKWRIKNQNKYLEDIVSSLISDALDFGESKTGREKMEWVIDMVKKLVPDAIMRDDSIEFFIQQVYDQIIEDLKEQKALEIQD